MTGTSTSLTEASAQHPFEVLPDYADIRTDVPPSLPSSAPDAASVNQFTTLHAFYLRTGKGRPWLTLNLRSRATSAKYLPLYCDRDVITGEVLLDLPAPERLKGITFTFRGSVQWTGLDEEFFLQQVVNLWSPPHGAATGDLAAGAHKFAIDFLIPTEISSSQSSVENPRLPPSFTERASPVYVNYQLSISMRRAGLSPNRKLITNIGYLPRQVAGRPSLMRSLAYESGTPLLGPDEDPPGWHVLQPVTITGNLFNDRTATVEYSLAIASPLSYVANSPIPLFLTLKSVDKHALDLFGSSQHDVRLMRVLAHAHDAADMRSSNTFLTMTGSAVFWPHHAKNTQGTRAMYGELHIPKGTKQSFTFGKISLILWFRGCSNSPQYQLMLMSPTVAGFSQPKASAAPLTSQTITVTVAAPKDVIIRSLLPPQYSDVHENPNFNLTTGLLENGNWRFVHVHTAG
ncbi:hypothetical protein K488DRAFT_44744 [Vararia minispora EC-137]|uniref:Uncharacterized protein n=1 Tax=Vararia minispora EC-137 TaxID=1314806 RepID=A0ACB8QSB7_9AGAM|nr:hypothetical protein K488DRAFT_44744 [Vararia minispora EC-137]